MSDDEIQQTADSTDEEAPEPRQGRRLPRMLVLAALALAGLIAARPTRPLILLPLQRVGPRSWRHSVMGFILRCGPRAIPSLLDACHDPELKVDAEWHLSQLVADHPAECGELLVGRLKAGADQDRAAIMTVLPWLDEATTRRHWPYFLERVADPKISDSERLGFLTIITTFVLDDQGGGYFGPSDVDELYGPTLIPPRADRARSLGAAEALLTGLRLALRPESDPKLITYALGALTSLRPLGRELLPRIAGLQPGSSAARFEAAFRALIAELVLLERGPAAPKLKPELRETILQLVRLNYQAVSQKDFDLEVEWLLRHYQSELPELMEVVLRGLIEGRPKADQVRLLRSLLLDSDPALTEGEAKLWRNLLKTKGGDEAWLREVRTRAAERLAKRPLPEDRPLLLDLCRSSRGRPIFVAGLLRSDATTEALIIRPDVANHLNRDHLTLLAEEAGDRPIKVLPGQYADEAVRSVCQALGPERLDVPSLLAVAAAGRKAEDSDAFIEALLLAHPAATARALAAGVLPPAQHNDASQLIDRLVTERAVGELPRGRDPELVALIVDPGRVADPAIAKAACGLNFAQSSDLAAVLVIRIRTGLVENAWPKARPALLRILVAVLSAELDMDATLLAFHTCAEAPELITALRGGALKYVLRDWNRDLPIGRLVQRGPVAEAALGQLFLSWDELDYEHQGRLLERAARSAEKTTKAILERLLESDRRGKALQDLAKGLLRVGRETRTPNAGSALRIIRDRIRPDELILNVPPGERPVLEALRALLRQADERNKADRSER